MSASSELCPFCDTESRTVLAKSKYSVAIADAFPVSAGHTLVIPLRHVQDLFDLTAEDLADAFALVGRIKEALQAKHSPAGFNIGVNIGRAAGQTVMHAHVHIIPRYEGDVSDPFGGVRGVIPGNARYSAS